MLEEIKDILPEKINPQEAVSSLSKNQSGALFVVSICISLILIFIIVFQNTKANSELREEKMMDRNECITLQKNMEASIDSLKLINERLHDSLVEYRMFRLFNAAQGEKQIIITPKK